MPRLPLSEECPCGLGHAQALLGKHRGAVWHRASRLCQQVRHGDCAELACSVQQRHTHMSCAGTKAAIQRVMALCAAGRYSRHMSAGQLACKGAAAGCESLTSVVSPERGSYPRVQGKLLSDLRSQPQYFVQEQEQEREQQPAAEDAWLQGSLAAEAGADCISAVDQLHHHYDVQPSTGKPHFAEHLFQTGSVQEEASERSLLDAGVLVSSGMAGNTKTVPGTRRQATRSLQEPRCTLPAMLTEREAALKSPCTGPSGAPGSQACTSTGHGLVFVSLHRPGP